MEGPIGELATDILRQGGSRWGGHRLGLNTTPLNEHPTLTSTPPTEPTMLRVTLRNGSVGALKTTQGSVFRSSSGYLQKCGRKRKVNGTVYRGLKGWTGFTGQVTAVFSRAEVVTVAGEVSGGEWALNYSLSFQVLGCRSRVYYTPTCTTHKDVPHQVRGMRTM